MNTQVGEYLVGSYFEFIEGCDVVSYNVKFPGEGMRTMTDFDVIAFDFKTSTAYVCEVATHMLNLAYGNSREDSVRKIKKKHENQKAYAAQYLKAFKRVRFQLWAMRVDKQQAALLREFKTLELVINIDYTESVKRLRMAAKNTTKQVNNPVFRTLQILEHLK